MTETLRVGYIGINFVSSSFSVPSQFLPSYFPKLIRAKVHDGNSEGRLQWYKMSFLKSILKQNAVYQSNFQMSRQCLQRSDVFYLTLQRFTVSTYIGDGLQSEDFQTFFPEFWFELTKSSMKKRLISSFFEKTNNFWKSEW